MKWIGLDPGTHTGLAVWDDTERKLLCVETMAIHAALHFVEEYARNNSVRVIFEDARQRKWYGAGNTTAKIQGAGSIKRDCAIWEDFLTDMGISFWAKPPGKGMTKVKPEHFRRLTGWTERTSEHSRDAAMLVFGK